MRRQAGNDLPAVAAIDPEVSIDGEKNGIGRHFAHPHQTGIGKAHRDIRVLLHELQHTLQFATEVKRRNDSTAAQESGQCRLSRGSQEKEGLGKGRLAGSPGSGKMRCLSRGPAMMAVAAGKQRDQETGVNEDASGHIRLP